MSNKDKNRGGKFTGTRSPNQPATTMTNTAEQVNNENANSATLQQGAVDSGTAADTANQSGNDAVQSGGDLGADSAGAAQGVQSGGSDVSGSGEDGAAGAAGAPGASDALAVGSVTATSVVSGSVVNDTPLAAAAPLVYPYDKAAEDVVKQAYEQPAGRGTFGGTLVAVDEAAFQEVSGPAVSALAAGLLEEFHAYVEAMDPKRPVAVATGAALQRRLFSTLRRIINDLDGNDFEVAFGQVLTTFAAHANGVFHDLAVYRFFDARELNLSNPDRLAFRNLINFLIRIAPAGSRHLVAEQVNMDAHFGHKAFTEEGRQRVQNFCNIR